MASTSILPGAALDLADLHGDRRRHRRERTVRLLFFAAAALSVVISVGIVFSLGVGAVRFITRVDLTRLWADGWFPRRNEFDLLTLLLGTLIVTVIAMLVAGPVGLGAAIFLSEYARPRVRRLLKPILEILAGIPSVVLGFFAISFISPSVIQKVIPGASFFNLLAAGIAVGILTIPLVASISEDAMRSVPLALREASYGLGSKKITTTTRVVVPAALSGVVAAMIIGISRAIGETMVVAIASGAVGGGLRTWNPLQPGQTMTAAMAALGTGTDQVVGSGPSFQSLYFIGMLLFLITLGLNVASEQIVRRFRERY
ncbi:MAG TPA: phosphate ABC transporter permease subunit PstC [Actinomycetes bacterium]|nr:phosphate ABC transporter permease subunit PstC [Actinomycetes bacterium]